ncbi:MAG: hypothetical protein AAF960_29980 [Bacteroidota bacterium]
MKDNYQFNINPSALDKESIEQHKDFDALLKRVEASPQPTNTPLTVASKKWYYWIGGIAATFLLAILALGQLSEQKSESATLAYLASQPYVQPPIEKVAQSEMVIQVDANEGGTYTFPTGSRMVVPKAAFANSYGALIQGEVQIHYKEYHDFVDFFLSGIPMEIKVDGQNRILESAGMIEVYATQDGERLQMVPDKPIDIELRSQLAFEGDTPPDFNIYYLNEKERTWQLEGKDEMEIVESTSANLNNSTVNSDLKFVNIIRDANSGKILDSFYMVGKEGEASESHNLNKLMREREQEIVEQKDQKIAALRRQYPSPKKPRRPEKYDGNSITFEFDEINDNAPKSVYDGTIWQVIEPIADMDKLTNTVWSSKELQQKANGSYELALTSGAIAANLLVKPVLVGNDYDKAVRQFKQQLVNYEKEKQRVAKVIAEQKRAIQEQAAIEKEMLDKEFAKKIAALKARGYDNYATNEIVKRTVTNRFQITRFGTWNCDRPLPPYLATLKGTFQDQDYNRYQNQLVYHTDKTRNTVSRFYLKDVADVQYNTNSDNLFWLVAEDNQLAVFYPEYFSRIDKKTGEYAFEMDLQPVEINSEEDVRRVLRL